MKEKKWDLHSVLNLVLDASTNGFYNERERDQKLEKQFYSMDVVFRDGLFAAPMLNPINYVRSDWLVGLEEVSVNNREAVLAKVVDTRLQYENYPPLWLADVSYICRKLGLSFLAQWNVLLKASVEMTEAEGAFPKVRYRRDWAIEELQKIEYELLKGWALTEVAG